MATDLAAGTYSNALKFVSGSNEFTGNGAGLTAIPASVLTGTALPSGIVSSSLTSLGTLTGLAVAGITNINVSNNFATNIGTGSTNSAVTLGNSNNTLTLNAGTTNLNGTTNIKGVTSINASNNAATNIGTGSTNATVSIGNNNNTVAIAGGTNTITGTTNTVSGTTNTLSGTTNNITGVTNINAGNNAATNIGTGSTTSAVNIGGGNNNVVLGATRGIIVTANGHLQTVGSAPSTSSCGGGSIVITGTDVAGKIDDGNSSNYTTCVLDFASAWTNPPTCMVQQTAGTKTTFLVSTTTTQLTISGLGNSRNRSFAWICLE